MGRDRELFDAEEAVEKALNGSRIVGAGGPPEPCAGSR